jgi:thiol-disulfide isomerase/thioredoxin
MMKGNTGDPDTQASIAEEVNDRMAKAQRELEEKYASGRGGQDTSVTGPTGASYKDAAKREQANRKAQKELRKAQRAENESDGYLKDNTLEEDDDEDDEEGDDDDSELRQIRENRIRQLKIQQREKLENIGKGHGQYREIVQDEFLKECTSSERVICHFYSDEFTRCAIMDKHISKLALRHVETKFIKINAVKAPFFVDKLKIMTMPTVVMFIDGVAIDKILGFEGLGSHMAEGKEDEWPTILLARLLATKRMIYNSSIVDDDGIEAAMKIRVQQARQKYIHNAISLDDDNDNFDLES